MAKEVKYLAPAAKALRQHKSVAKRIMNKIAEYAANPEAFANNTKALTGRSGKRLRVGDFRVLFEETEKEIIVSDIGPRSGVYKD